MTYHDLPIKNDDFPVRYVKWPEGKSPEVQVPSEESLRMSLGSTSDFSGPPFRIFPLHREGAISDLRHLLRKNPRIGLPLTQKKIKTWHIKNPSNIIEYTKVNHG